ncbi:unnamed protein product, partial [Heterotrigona itama]
MYEQNSPQFITISIAMLIQVYMFAWPADHSEGI